MPGEAQMVQGELQGGTCPCHLLPASMCSIWLKNLPL